MSYTSNKLNNGITLVTKPDKNASSVYFELYVGGGGLFETEESVGLSHLLEHLIARNINNMDNSWLKDYVIEGFQATTFKNRIVFKFKSSSEDVDRCLEILRNILTFQGVDENDYENEKNIIFEEILGDEDDPDQKIADYYDNFFYQSEGAFGVKGTADDVKKFVQKDAVGLFNELFVPGNVFLTVVGSFKEADLRTEIESIPLSTGKAREAAKAAVREPVFHFEKTDDSQNYLSTIRPLYSIDSVEKCVKLEFFVDILYAYLFEKIRNQGFCYDLFVRSVIVRGFADFSIEGFFEPAKTVDFYHAVQEKSEEFIKNLTEEELEKFKKICREELTMTLDNPANELHFLSWYAYTFGKPLDIEGDIKIIESITLDDIRDLYKEIFTIPETLIIAGQLTDPQLYELKK